jgi:ATP-binding cassette subfamily B protein
LGTNILPNSANIPEALREVLARYGNACSESLLDSIQPSEKLEVWFEPNLDDRLRFDSTIVVLSTQALYAWDKSSRKWNRWSLSPSVSLRKVDRTGLGVLELFDDQGLIAHWRYTAAQLNGAASVVTEYQKIRSGEDDSGAASICPSCGGPMQDGQVLCSNCAPTAVPSTTRSLMRLTRFARPRALIIAFGFALTILSTTAAMIPPLLTKPLMDYVLIPHQSNLPARFDLVPWLLGGMLLAALLSWALSWAKTYVMATISERISADLRNATYGHLQKLSLEFFGGKRTGDLISRVSDDTQRICDFLSIHTVDFVTDIIMIVITAALLIWLDPTMALVGLLPFPFIAWIVARVQARMRAGFARGSSAWAEMVNVLADTIPGIRVVKAFAQEDREVARFDQTHDHVQ